MNKANDCGLQFGFSQGGEPLYVNLETDLADFMYIKPAVVETESTMDFFITLYR